MEDIMAVTRVRRMGVPKVVAHMLSSSGQLSMTAVVKTGSGSSLRSGSESGSAKHKWRHIYTGSGLGTIRHCSVGIMLMITAKNGLQSLESNARRPLTYQSSTFSGVQNAGQSAAMYGGLSHRESSHLDWGILVLPQSEVQG